MTYKLDKINRLLLYELDKNARISDNQLAKKVNRSREAVRNRIKKLEEDGIIQGFYAALNPSKCGYMFFKIYLQLANIPKERKKFETYFSKLPGLYWHGGNDGVWDFHTAIYAKSVKEFNKIKNKIYTDWRHLIIKRTIGVLINVRGFPKRYLLPEKKECPEGLMFADDVIPYELDALDKTLLQELSKNCRTPLVTLAKKTGTTVDIIRGRIKKLEQKGIIMQYRVDVDHIKLGYTLFKAFVYFNNLSEKAEQKLINYTKHHPKINYMIRQLSAWDVELEIMTQGYEEFTDIMNDIREEFSDVIRNYESALMRQDIFFFGDKKIELIFP